MLIRKTYPMPPSFTVKLNDCAAAAAAGISWKAASRDYKLQVQHCKVRGVSGPPQWLVTLYDGRSVTEYCDPDLAVAIQELAGTGEAILEIM